MKLLKNHPIYGHLIYSEKGKYFNLLKKIFIIEIIFIIPYIIILFFTNLLNNLSEFLKNIILELLFYSISFLGLLLYIKTNKIAIYTRGLFLIKKNKFINENEIKSINLKFTLEFNERKTKRIIIELKNHESIELNLNNEFYIIDKIISENFRDIEINIDETKNSKSIRELVQKKYRHK